MKKTLKIAKLELSNLFYSPIAWLLFLVFIIQASMSFTDMLEGLVRSKDYSGASTTFFFLTKSMFCRNGTLFPSLLGRLYLYIPLLTMGLISREINSGTISLLYSSPVKIREIVAGKFLAMVVYNLCLIFILTLFVFTASFAIHRFDYGLVFSALLGIFLLLCTYSAIGLFMSSLTSYQIVAALSTFVVFAFLAYVGGLWQGVDFVRDLTYFLSISGRTEKMIAGLITTKDIAYFIVIIAMFLVFSVLKLKAGREAKPWFVRAARYLLCIICALFLGYITSRPGYIGYYDATLTKTNTLTKNAQKIIEGLDSPLEITSYINLLDRHYGLGSPEMRNADLNRWEPYIRFKKDINLKYVYYYDSIPQPSFYMYGGNKGLNIKQISERMAKIFKINLKRFLTPDQIHKIINLRPEGNPYIMQLKYKGKTTFLRLYNDAETFPSETEVSAAIKRLTVKLPVVAFLQGDYERSPDKIGDRDYRTLTSEKTFRYALINQGFDVESIQADSSLREIPSNISVLVIADPRKALEPAASAVLQQYIANGGNLMVLGEPGKQQIVNSLLQATDVRLMNGQLVQKSRDFAANLVLPYLTKASGDMSQTMRLHYLDSLRISMPGAAALAYNNDSSNFKVSPLLITDILVSWNKMGNLVLDSAAVSFDGKQGDQKGAFPTALALTRTIHGKLQRIIVTGDADLMSNAELGRGNVATGNFDFNTALFGWFTDGEFPIDSSRPKPEDIHFLLNDKEVAVLNIIFLWVLPGLVVIFSTILLIRRKRK
ncbi:ABC transporter [Arachidicoccus ginsenosidimutans]|uniref:Gldg family protein n=1 Tax=Arachidicoccus sp. BS20 TaxID=1850526 RepID=UPI0007F05F82|nr:Gldg family protein [Arachidicoccus sp. BS20]ANI88194.1 ABC transporter [Arachidicoccus sp. BS20]